MATHVIVQGPDDVVMQFAADELVKYAAKISGESAGRGEPGQGVNLFLRLDPAVGGNDAFLLRSEPQGLVIAAAAPRALLYGVYAYLESLGARFPHPGERHEVIPSRSLVTGGYDRHETPSFAKRGMTFAYDAADWIDWSGKQRLNWVFHHTQFNDDWWSRNRDKLWPELQKRGMTLELGGHYLPHFIPREMYRQHPEWFRFANGARVNEYNFCPSNPEAMAFLKDRVRRYVSQAIEADVFNIWADDTAEDTSTWCFCEQCQEYSPSDQNLIVMNAMAEAVKEVKPTGKLVYIAYHETIAPPQKVAPADNIVLMYAPRERCYAHALNDPDCAKNRQHAQWLEDLVKVFDPSQAEIFEYYPDQVVFNHMLPAITDTIQGDMRYYKSLGIGLMEPLLTPFTHDWITPPTTPILQSVAQWNLDADLDALLADHATTYFGNALMVDFYRHREAALHPVLKSCDYHHPVAAFWVPPLELPEAVAKHLAEMEAALPHLAAARGILARAARHAEGPYVERIHQEEEAFNLASRRINGQIHHARGVLAYNHFKASGSPADAKTALGHFEHAYADLNESRLRNRKLNRTMRYTDTLIHTIAAESSGEHSNKVEERPNAAQVMARLPASLLTEQAGEAAGSYEFRFFGQTDSPWTVTIGDGQCTVSAGKAPEPDATAEMAEEDFVAWMFGEVGARDLLMHKTNARLTGDAVKLMELPTVFRIR